MVLRRLVRVSPAAAPLGPRGVVQQQLGVREAGPPQKFRDVGIAMGKSENFDSDGDVESAGRERGD